MTKQCYLRGFGSFAPPKVLTNDDLATFVETSDEWIKTRTGIEQRHIVDPGQCTSDLVTEAAKAALNDASLAVADLTHILVATFTPDAYCPNTACVVEDKLGTKGLMAMDMSAACSGFVYGLQVARGLVSISDNATILLSGAETMSSRTNWKDRNTCVLFGDAAGAVVISPTPGPNCAELIDVEVSSDGALRDLLTVTGGGSSMPYTLDQPVPAEHFVMMQGREVFKHAVRSMTSVCETLLERNGLTNADIDLLIPHQANMRIIDAVGKKLDMPEGKVFVNLQKYGNTSAASIPLALADARAQGAIKPGMTVLLTTFGGGFTWGSALLKFL